LISLICNTYPELVEGNVFLFIHEEGKDSDIKEISLEAIKKIIKKGAHINYFE
jgi:hypothetical protein